MSRPSSRLPAVGLVAMAAVVFFASPVCAEGEDVPGEIVVKTNLEFVKFTVNGKRNWENHEYSQRNKTLTIMGMTRGQENVVELRPRQEGYFPVTLTLTDSDYRRRRVRHGGRSVAVFRAVKTVKFSKNKPKPTKIASPKKSNKSKKSPKTQKPSKKTAPAKRK